MTCQIYLQAESIWMFKEILIRSINRAHSILTAANPEHPKVMSASLSSTVKTQHQLYSTSTAQYLLVWPLYSKNVPLIIKGRHVLIPQFVQILQNMSKQKLMHISVYLFCLFTCLLVFDLHSAGGAGSRFFQSPIISVKLTSKFKFTLHHPWISPTVPLQKTMNLTV